jgi:hypothetical protein
METEAARHYFSMICTFCISGAWGNQIGLIEAGTPKLTILGMGK